MAEILIPFLAAVVAENKVALSEIAQGEVPETNLRAGVPVNRQL